MSDFKSPKARLLWSQAQEQWDLAERAAGEAKTVHTEKARDLERQAFEHENAWQQSE
jgi:hypothetical protein